LGPRFAHAAAGPDDEIDGVLVVSVTVDARLPLVAWFLPDGPTVHATGHAVLER
jgi:hypothetical protein